MRSCPRSARPSAPSARSASAYRDNNGADSRRTIWPFALSFFEKVRVVVAWCELREDYRHFRTDRIVVLNMTEKRYPRRRQAHAQGNARERELTKEASENRASVSASHPDLLLT